MAATQLPTELLAAIFEPLSPAELASAAAVCWRFNAVAERLLYANVHIVDVLYEGEGEDEEQEEDEVQEEDEEYGEDSEGYEYEESGEESDGIAMSEGEDDPMSRVVETEGDGDEDEVLTEEEDEEEEYSDSDDDYDAYHASLVRKDAPLTPWRTLRWASALRRRAYLWDSVRRVHIRWQAVAAEDQGPGAQFHGRSPTHSPSHSLALSQQSETETRRRREREAEAQRQFGLHQSYSTQHQQRQQQQSSQQRDVYTQQQHQQQRNREEAQRQMRCQQSRRRQATEAGLKQRSAASENPLASSCDRLGAILCVLTALESLELFLGPANFIRVRLPASVPPVPAHAFATHGVLETHSYRQPLAFQPQPQVFALQTQQPPLPVAQNALSQSADSVPLLHAIERVVQACVFSNLRALSLGVDSQPKTASSSPTQSSASLSHYAPPASSPSSYALNVPYSPYTLNAAPYSPYTSYASSNASSSVSPSPYAYAYPYASPAYASSPTMEHHQQQQQQQPTYTIRQPAYSTILPAFLARLPQLTHLRIAASSSSSSSAYFDADGGDSGLASALAHLPPHALPALQSFRGSARAAARLVPGRNIMQLALAGRDEDVMGSSGAGATMMGAYNGGGALPLLAQGAVPLRVLDLSAMSARPMLLRNVAQVLSTLECLRVKLALRHTLHYSFSGIRMLAPLANVLSLLPNLTFLDLAPTGVDGFGRADPQSTVGHDTEERALCAEWARACPSLRRVIFPSQSDWVRSGDDMMALDADTWTLSVAAES